MDYRFGWQAKVHILDRRDKYVWFRGFDLLRNVRDYSIKCSFIVT